MRPARGLPRPAGRRWGFRGRLSMAQITALITALVTVLHGLFTARRLYGTTFSDSHSTRTEAEASTMKILLPSRKTTTTCAGFPRQGPAERGVRGERATIKGLYGPTTACARSAFELLLTDPIVMPRMERHRAGASGHRARPGHQGDVHHRGLRRGGAEPPTRSGSQGRQGPSKPFHLKDLVNEVEKAAGGVSGGRAGPFEAGARTADFAACDPLRASAISPPSPGGANP